MTDFTLSTNKERNIIVKIMKSIEDFSKRKKLNYEDALEEEDEILVEDVLNINVNHRSRIILV